MPKKVSRYLGAFKEKAYKAFIAVLLLAPSTALAQGWSTGRSNASSFGLPGNTVMGIIATAANWLLAIFGFLGIIAFVISGILYLTAAGDEGQIDRAKNAMQYSIIGVIVALIGWVIINAVDSWLRGSSFF